MPSKRPARSGTGPQRRSTLVAADDISDRKTILYGVGPAPEDAEAYWQRKGWGGPRGDLRLPKLRNERDRKPNLLADKPAVFPIERNPDADPTAPLWSRHSKGREAVLNHRPIIEAAAERHGVDPDLVKAVVYTENARGWISRYAQDIGIAESLLPMNIKPAMWRRLGVAPEDAKEPAANIDLGVRLIKGLVERVPGASAAEIETLYNNLYAETTNHLGAFAQHAYDHRLWNQEETPEYDFGKRLRATEEQGLELVERRLR